MAKSWFSGLLGKISHMGVEQELMQGIDFRDGLELTPNAETKLLEVRSSGAGTGVGGAPNARIRVLGAGLIGGGSDDSHADLTARDGVTLVDGDVVLDVGHSTSALRGYWIARAGAWTPPDFYDLDDEVAALVGTFTTILEGTIGAGQCWRHVSGDTLAGGKFYDEVLGSPDTVIGENGSIVELGLDEGTGTGRTRAGSRIRKDISTTIASGATATVWDWDGAALGMQATDIEGFAPNVFAKWAADAKYFWGARCALVAHGAPPTIIEKRAQAAMDGAAGANNYLTLDWDLSGNILRLRATNNRASACSVRVYANYGAFE